MMKIVVYNKRHPELQHVRLIFSCILTVIALRQTSRFTRQYRIEIQNILSIKRSADTFEIKCTWIGICIIRFLPFNQFQQGTNNCCEIRPTTEILHETYTVYILIVPELLMNNAMYYSSPHSFYTLLVSNIKLQLTLLI